MNINAMEEKEYETLKENLEIKKISEMDTYKITLNIFKSRAPFTQVFTTGMFVKLAFKKMLPKCCRKKKKLALDSEQEKAELLYANGQKKFFHELDVVNLLQSVRLSKLLVQSQLTRRQRVLLQFQRKQLIESQDDSEYSDYEQIMKDLESKNPFVRIFTLGKINKILKTYA